MTINPERGVNYGRKLAGAVQAVPFDRSVKLYNPQYISLLHWRTQVPKQLPEEFVAAKNVPPGRRPFDVQQIEFFGITAPLAEIRADVAKNYELVIRSLTAATGLGIIILIALITKLAALYREFAQQALLLGYQTNLAAFLAQQPDLLLEEAKQDYRRRQDQLKEQTRVEESLRRQREALEQRLRFLQDTLPDESDRSRIRECLSTGDLAVDKMEALWRELQPRVGDKTPEERLNLLLESSQDYLNAEEFERVCNEAFELLRQSGFRQAREFAVNLHRELRARTKASEQNGDEDSSSESDVRR